MNLPNLPFRCPRSCRWAEREDICRFMPVLVVATCNDTVVTSHTTTVKVEFRSMSALARAVERLGGRAIGEGSHRLYSSTEAGYAVQLPGWRYPIVARSDGQLAMDHYNGSWGDPRDIDRLTRVYILEAAREAADAIGWMIVAEDDSAITIAHPDGGTLTVHADGWCEAAGFCGADCHATAPIEEALGRPIERLHTLEYYAERARVRAREEEQ
jgi:hypothetical protein